MTTTASGRSVAHARRRFWRRVWTLVFGSALAYVPVALAPQLLHAVVHRTDELVGDHTTPERSGVLTTLSMGEAASVLGVLAALVIALNIIAWSIGPVVAEDGSPRITEALRTEHLELCGPVFGVGATMTFVAALLDGMPHSVDLAALLLFPAVFVIVVLSQDLFLATRRGGGVRRMLLRENSLLRRRELLVTAARLRPRDPRAATRPFLMCTLELVLLTAVTTAVALLPAVALGDGTGGEPVLTLDDIVGAAIVSAIVVLMAVVLVPWTVRCWLLHRYVGAVLAVAVGGTLYLVVAGGIVWAVLDGESSVDALVSVVPLLVWVFLPVVVLAVGTLGIRGRGRLPGVTAALRSALLRERFTLRWADTGDGRGAPELRPLLARARRVASYAGRS
ncbi:hypothetical protein OED52_14785 [Rhodococcus sp. Z13]|uniref:Uncharacterized protein n=1 Tax=Rhodococcus sacchari TaxID=2962047 RepID=A0ACD4DCW8_9NOCA|nr:hypothetical protein [Rhodococcus sp. Z13]UYP17927.1 hypothetical protein OED52_14785 [Rhodococcus sp. Z13]